MCFSRRWDALGTLGPTHTFGLAPTRAALGFSGRSRHMNFGTGCVQGGLAHVGLGLGRAGDDSGHLAHGLPWAGAVAAGWRALAMAAAGRS